MFYLNPNTDGSTEG